MTQVRCLGIAIALAFGLMGCEQRPADNDTDPPPITPNDGAAPEAPPRQPLGDRTGEVAPPAADGQERPTGIAAAAPRARARAELMPTRGNDVRGTVEFTRSGAMLNITAAVSGLAPGEHGIHVHENGDCSAPDGSSAGDHFAPEGDPHGAPTAGAAEHHLGDLGNITADASGSAELAATDDELELTGERGVVGKAVIVHSGADDLETQPDGAAGMPVACGVIELAAESVDRG